MIEDIELITLLGGLIVLGFLVWNRRVIRRAPWSWVLVAAYACVLGGWVMTVLESLVFPVALNLAEHGLYACGSLLLAVWAILVVRERDCSD